MQLVGKYSSNHMGRLTWHQSRHTCCTTSVMPYPSTPRLISHSTQRSSCIISCCNPWYLMDSLMWLCWHLEIATINLIKQAGVYGHAAGHKVSALNCVNEIHFFRRHSIVFWTHDSCVLSAEHKTCTLLFSMWQYGLATLSVSVIINFLLSFVFLLPWNGHKRGWS